MTNEELAITLARVDERTASTHELIKKHVQDDEEKHRDFENRIRKNERFKWALLGGAGLSTAGMTAFFKNLFG